MTALGFTRRGVLLGAAAALAVPSVVRAVTLAEIKKRGYMTVATEDDYQPFEFTQNGKPTGYDQELLELFKKKAGFEIRQDIIPWTGILPGVTTGKYDAAVTAILVTHGTHLQVRRTNTHRPPPLAALSKLSSFWRAVGNW
jgi:polar amino acid transport system substrate-binding protein